MLNKLKGLIGIVSVVMLIYFVCSGNTLVAEDGENDAQERFAGATISVEASVVIVGLEALEEIAGELDGQNLNSIPLEKIMRSIREDEGGEMVSIVKLAVGNESDAEINTEERVDTKRKHPEEGAGVHENRQINISFRVTPKIIDMNRIAVSFDFKQIVSENTLASEREAEEQEDRVIQFEVSSELVLRPGQPRIVGATQKGEAIFLIMGVDI
ncbi:MAG: hypothetical protein FVQ84_21115 [Planctomycetes bacterium]|nr:hypothetical protein [Planctomycetota bacterium]